MADRTRKRATVFLIVTVLVALVGCGNSDPQTRKGSDANQNQLDRKISNVIRPLKLVKEEYKSAVKKGNVINQGEYTETLMFAEKTIKNWKTLKPALSGRLSPGDLNQLNREINQLVSHVRSKKSVQTEERLVDSIHTTLTDLRGGNVSARLMGVVKSIKRADRDITAEKTAHNQRIGIALTNPAPIYQGNEITSARKGSERQLRVVLRTQRSKRNLPGASVQAQFLNPSGQELKNVTLSETWGPYIFYGKNLTVPDKSERLTITVVPSTVGRHADMKSISTESFSVSFDLRKENDSWTVQGPEPRPTSEEYTLGSDVQMALEEPIAFRSSGPYKIGLIAERAEPFWTPLKRNGKVRMRMAKIPENANRHMEIILLEKGTNRIIPHAKVSLRIFPREGRQPITTKLPFLLSAFNHYGNSLVIPPGHYRVKATIRQPDLGHLEKNRFPNKVNVVYKWTNKKVR